MISALRKPRMTREQFFAWAQTQDIPHEVGGFEPVAMAGGTVNHSQITQNIQRALYTRLRGSFCRPLGPDAGVATVGDTVRCPDALLTRTKVPGTATLVPGVVAVFEVLRPTSGRTDRIDKVREYRAVRSIRRYVIVEHSSIGLTVLNRAGAVEAGAVEDRRATDLIKGDGPRMTDLGIQIPVDVFDENVDLPPVASGDAGTTGNTATAP